jgi:hypothetical protein
MLGQAAVILLTVAAKASSKTLKKTAEQTQVGRSVGNEREEA